MRNGKALGLAPVIKKGGGIDFIYLYFKHGSMKYILNINIITEG